MTGQEEIPVRVQATQERSKEMSRGNYRERSQERLRGKVSKETKRGITREIPGNIETIKKMVAAERERVSGVHLWLVDPLFKQLYFVFYF